MRAYRIHDYDGYRSLRLDDLPEPAPGHGEVVVAIKAVSLNYRDLMMCRGQYSRALRLPLVPVSDGAGVVVAVGPGVEGLRAGDRVVSNFMTGWIDGPIRGSHSSTALGGAIDGMLAQFRAIDASALATIPPGMTFEEAACLPCAGVTAWNALYGAERLTPGEIILVQGTGGVSLFALQLARLAGARVIATTGRDEKRDRLAALGASDIINYKTNPSWGVEARERSGGEGVDLVVEVGGANTLEQSIQAVRPGGRIAIIGLLGGRGAVDTVSLLMKSIDLRGLFVGSRSMLHALIRALDLGGVRPVIDRVFPFEDAQEAFAHMESEAHLGKIVIAI